jgi:hypothetical protein
MTVEPTPVDQNGANRFVVTGFDRVLSVQRPVVLAHIRGIRSSRPNASPQEIIRILERRYLAAVTTGGALVGASAVIPAVGVGASLALSGVETAGFLEASALFAQSITEIHGISVEDPERARTLVMTLVLGSAGSDLVKQLAGQAVGVGPGRTAFWGELVTKNLPKAAVSRIGKEVRNRFVKRFAVSQGTTALGRAIPFGIGAVVGGTGNHLLGRQIISGTRTAFPPPPATFPDDLAPRIRVPRAPGERRFPQLKNPMALMRRRKLDNRDWQFTWEPLPDEPDAPTPTPTP